MSQKDNNKALLVLDLQEICVGKKHAFFFKYDKKIVAKANNIIRSNQNVIYIRTLLKDSFINKIALALFFKKTAITDLADGLIVKGDAIFDKYEGNAFTNPKLIDYLKTNGINNLEIIGIDGGGCVSKTALGAIENGFKIVLNTKAIDTMLPKKMDKFFKLLKEKGASFV